MKLSQMATDSAADVLCVITPNIYNILSDNAVVEHISKAMDTGKSENLYSKGILFVNSIIGIIPLLLKDHRADVYGILSVLNQRTVEEIASQNIAATIQQIREAIQDEDLRSFFKLFAPTAKNEQSAPSVPSQD